MIGLADVGGYNKDSGLFLKDHSLFSPGPAEFTSYSFLTELNPGLPWDVAGTISGQSVTLEVPANVDVSNLIATYTESGAYVSVNGIMQTSGVTANDFTDTVVYQLEGHDLKEWLIIAELVTGWNDVNFEKVVIAPNPAGGTFEIRNAEGFNARLADVRGVEIMRLLNPQNRSIIRIGNLAPGIYFIELEKNGLREIRKIMVN
jgi:hypothetical protein